MYQFFYELKGMPFELTPDPNFFFSSQAHKRALAYLHYGLNKEEGFLVLTGDIGTGKTMLVSTLFEEIDKKQVVAAGVVTSQLEDHDMLAMVAASFGLEYEAENKTTLIKRLETFMIECHTKGRHVLLVVDEAQNIPYAALEELRLLSNLQHKGRALLQIYLFGQEEFRDMLRSEGLEQLRQRVVAAYHLGPLQEDETHAYIDHRLRTAGWTGNPHLTDDTYGVIHRYAGGVPRRINTLCDRILLHGYLEEISEITADIAGVVIEELRQESFIDAGARGAIKSLADKKPLQVLRRDAELVGMIQGIDKQMTELREQMAQGLDALNGTARQRAKEALASGNPVIRRAPARGSGVLCVVGADPSRMKIAPVIGLLRDMEEPVKVRVVFTGPQDDAAEQDLYFKGIDVPDTDIELEVFAGSHAQQIAQIMERFEPILAEEDPACVLVVGDTSTTLACALVASTAGVSVAHVEAGLRSFDRTMPEEINRILTDQIADLLFVTEPRGCENLHREGAEKERIHLVGNLLIDTLLHYLDQAIPPAETAKTFGLDASLFEGEGGYALLNLQRPSITGDADLLKRLLKTFRGISDSIPIVFSVHPAAAACISGAGMEDLIDTPGILRTPPLSYLQTLGLMAGARVVFADLGGMQEETTALGVPCITLREGTDRPITVEQGTNMIVGTDPNHILAAFEYVLNEGGKEGQVPALWDGHAAERIRDILVTWLNGRAR